MLYLSGIHALNLPCELRTCGDRHQSAIPWADLQLLESYDSILGDYGIEENKAIPEHTEPHNVANHIRALLDLLEKGKFCIAQGMRDDFICNDEYTHEIFNKAMWFKHLDNWPEIDDFFEKEYLSQWLIFKRVKLWMFKENGLSV